MAPVPTANEISVRQVLEKFEAEFLPVADAVENGEFALWTGSGISREAPSLGNLVERAFDYIRERAIDPATTSSYLPALEEALGLAEIDPVSVRTQYSQPLAAWPEHPTIVGRLWNKYSRVLDIRIAGTTTDFVLWEAINIRQAFAAPPPPSAEHLCIAILILEGAVNSVASANWDGFIEAAVERLSSGTQGVLQVVVDPDQLRGPAGRARLFKFHGCILHATREPLVFRRFLTGSYTQIMNWPQNPEFAAMCNAVVGLATAQKTLVLGLSIQDNNLQTLFARAKQAHAWPWPCTPAAPAHVFCEDAIQGGQRDVLRISYGEAYNSDPSAIHTATLLRAWGEKVLIALTLKLLTDKLTRLMKIALSEIGKEPIADALEPVLKSFRDEIADQAVPAPGAHNRTLFVNEAIATWSRLVAIFRTGRLPLKSDAYETLTGSSINLLTVDHNAQSMKLGCLGIILSLLRHGHVSGFWELSPPASSDLISGSLTARASRPDAQVRRLFFVKSAAEAIALQSNGAFVHGNAIIVHADDAWHRMVATSRTSRRVRGAPGRIGHVGETHISLSDLLVRSNTAVTLHQDFNMEMML